MHFVDVGFWSTRSSPTFGYFYLASTVYLVCVRAFVYDFNHQERMLNPTIKVSATVFYLWCNSYVCLLWSLSSCVCPPFGCEINVYLSLRLWFRIVLCRLLWLVCLSRSSATWCYFWVPHLEVRRIRSFRSNARATCLVSAVMPSLFWMWCATCEWWSSGSCVPFWNMCICGTYKWDLW